MQDNPSDAELERQLEKWAGWEPAAEIPEELHHRVLERLKPSLTPVKPIARQSLLVFQFFGIFVLGAAVIVAIVRKAGFHLMTKGQIGWMSLVVAGGAVLFSVILARQMVPGARGISVFVAFGLSGLAVITGVGLNFPWVSSGSFVSEGWPCAVLELTIAAPATFVFWSFARHGALFASAKLGAALVGLAVFTALAPLQVQCMFLQAPHLLVWHGGTAALLIGLGALIGSMRWSEWIFRRRR